MITSKYLSQGVKPLLQYGNNPECLIIVEDVISAIKLGRVVTSTPLLGATMPQEWKLQLSGGFKKYFIWLDKDKQKESVRMAMRCSQVWGNCGVISTELDPKCYNNRELQQILMDAGMLQFVTK